MSLRKRTYSLPLEMVGDFERRVPAGQRSEVIAELIRDYLDRARRAQLRRQVIEGCRDMADLYLQVEQEFHPLEEEIHRGLEGKSKARRRRSSSARSG